MEAKGGRGTVGKLDRSSQPSWRPRKLSREIDHGSPLSVPERTDGSPTGVWGSHFTWKLVLPQALGWPERGTKQKLQLGTVLESLRSTPANRGVSNQVPTEVPTHIGGGGRVARQAVAGVGLPGAVTEDACFSWSNWTTHLEGKAIFQRHILDLIILSCELQQQPFPSPNSPSRLWFGKSLPPSPSRRAGPQPCQHLISSLSRIARLLGSLEAPGTGLLALSGSLSLRSIRALVEMGSPHIPETTTEYARYSSFQWPGHGYK